MLAVAAVVKGGCRILQYRNKMASSSLRRTQALALARYCKDMDVLLIVNDDIELAMEVGADGVHLGGSDGDWAAARTLIGPTRLLGASCYADLALARKAVAAGADYVAFGAVYPSTTKPAATRVSLQVLAQACRELPCPVAAIGGITLANASAVMATGVSLLAVISDVFERPDIALQASEFQSLFV